jgi:hypothetical protein
VSFDGAALPRRARVKTGKKSRLSGAFRGDFGAFFVNVVTKQCELSVCNNSFFMEIAAKINFARLEAPEAHAGHANIPDLPPSTQPVWQRPSGQSDEQWPGAQKPVVPTKIGMTDIMQQMGQQ